MRTNVPHIFAIGDMIGEIALAIEMGADAVDIGKTIHPHPRWENPLAWRRKWRMAVVRTCHRRRSNAGSRPNCYTFSSWPRIFRKGYAAFLSQGLQHRSRIAVDDVKKHQRGAAG